jgi:hypothetical protein
VTVARRRRVPFFTIGGIGPSGRGWFAEPRAAA